MASVRNRQSSNTTAATLALDFTETAPLDSSFGIFAHVRSYINSTTVDPTPTNIAALQSAGWTVLPGAGITAGGTGGAFKVWSAVLAIRGNGSVNGISITGESTAKQITLVAVPNVKAATFWDTPTLASSTSNVTQLALGAVTPSEADSTMLAFAAITGSAGGSGFTAGSSFTVKNGTSQFSVSTFAEATVPAGSAVSTAIGWTTASAARGFLVAARTAVPTAPGDGGSAGTYPRVYAWRNGQKFPARIRGIISGGVERPVPLWYVNGVNPPEDQPRDAFLHPFAVDDWSNVPLSTSATLASASDPVTMRLNARASNGVINMASFSTAIADGRSSSAVLATVRHPSNGTVYGSYRIPPTFVPPSGNQTTVDGNSVLFQPGDTGADAYRLNKISNTEWTSTSVDVQDFRGSSRLRGVRAAGISLAVGLMRTWAVDEILAGRMLYFPWVLALSIPKEHLKLRPTSADGQVMYNGAGEAVAVYPAKEQDNQDNIKYVTDSDAVSMGTTFALPASFNAETWVINGTPATVAQKALARTLQRFGTTVLDQSGTWALYMEPGSNGTARTQMETAWRALMPSMRRVTNITSTRHGGGPEPRVLGTPAARPFTLSAPVTGEPTPAPDTVATTVTSNV